jgi:Phosphotransferase enzyme family
MGKREAAVDPAVAVAEALLGGCPDSIEPVAGGRNSRVYRVEIGGKLFALKRYPSLADDPRDRLATEVEALALMAACGLANVPRVIALDRKLNFALLSWLEGAQITCVSDADIDQAAAFLKIIHGMRDGAAAGFYRDAAEACLSGTEVEAQIRRRLAVLHSQCVGELDLVPFLSESFAPLLEQLANAAKAKMAAAGLDFRATLPQEKRTLVPSDFGFHNALRRADGTLAFVDFEYFGWDDPVKLTADVLHHPGTPLGALQRDRFRSAALAIYGADASFGARLDALYPLFGLRWALIVLNEFLPDRWRLRVAAGETDSWAQAKTRQLARARELVAQTQEMANG